MSGAASPAAAGRAPHSRTNPDVVSVAGRLFAVPSFDPCSDPIFLSPPAPLALPMLAAPSGLAARQLTAVGSSCDNRYETI